MRLSKKITAGTISALMLANVFSMTGCSKNYMSPSNDKDALVVTVGDSKVYMDEAKCYVYISEAELYYTNILYMRFGVNDYMNQASSDDDSKTNAQVEKDSVMKDIIEKEILYNEAQSTGKYDISDEQLKKIEENAKTVISLMSKRELKKTGFTEEDFVNVQKKWNIANQYKKDVIKDFNITKESMEKKFDYDKDLRQYETTYIRASVTNTDSSGEEMEMSDDQKKEVMETMKKVKKKVDSGKSFDDIVKDFDKNTVESAKMNYTQGNYTDLKDSKSDDTEAGEEYMKATVDMTNGAISGIFEADGYYYIAKMDNNDSSAAYDSKVTKAVTDEENSQLDKWIDQMKEGDYKCEINSDVWDSFDLGYSTIIEDEFKKTFGLLENPADSKKSTNTTTSQE